MIIGLTGTNGAGKNTIADYLVEKGFVHFCTRDILIEELKKHGLQITRDTLIETANKLREQYGSDYLAKQLCERAQKSEKNAVIESFRTLGEIKMLKSYPQSFLRGVDANPEIRYQRIQTRNDKHSDLVSFEEFSKQEAREYNNTDPTKANLKECFTKADKQFMNNGTKEDLYKEIARAFGNLSMEYTIQELNDKNIHNTSLYETLSNLTETPLLSPEETKKILHTMLQQGTKIFVAITPEEEIIGCVSLLVEQKFIRGGAKAGHIEDVATRKGYEGKGISSELIKTAIQEAKKLGCYKIILDCDQNTVGFYERFGFTQQGIFMRQYV